MNQMVSPATYRLHSSTVVYMPGLIAWAINGYAFDKDRMNILKAMAKALPGVPVPALQKLLTKAVPYSIEAEAVVFAVDNQSPCQRFNNLCTGDTLERFAWFELVACRKHESDGCIVQCEAERAEFWGIYGRANEGTEEDPEYLATAVHDASTPLEAVQIARQISFETGKGFVTGDAHFGQFPRRNGQVEPVAEFTELAEDLTFAIHEDNEDKIADEDRRVDDFDTHPLADLREAFVEYLDYAGNAQRDPYQSVAEHMETGADQ
jgi:hypothetical protein